MKSPDDEPPAESTSENGPLSDEESIDSLMEEELDSQNSSTPASEIPSSDQETSDGGSENTGPSDDDIFERALHEKYGDDEETKERIRDSIFSDNADEEE